MHAHVTREMPRVKKGQLKVKDFVGLSYLGV